MGRLFWKFLFSFWAALLVTVLGVTTALWLYQLAQRGRDRFLESGPRAATLVGAAAATLRYGGVEALAEHLEARRRQGDVFVFAVDDAGRDLLGRTVAPAALEQARTLASSPTPREFVHRETTASGSSLVLFVPLDATHWLNRTLFRGGPPPPAVPLLSGLLASLIFGALLAWYVARPIRHLQAAFGALSEGRLEIRVGALMGGRRDEVADLGRDFDAMAQQLAKLIGAQRTLLHEVSHELRSPLARLQAAIGLARQDPQTHEAALERIEREVERVDELVGQLLTLSRLESRIDERQEPLDRVELVDLVAAVVEDAAFEAEASGRAVAFEAGVETLAEVRAELLHRAVENVVRNAVKYTLPGTTVEVSAGPTAGGSPFVVRVADRGPGVAGNELDAIFEPFYRSAGSSGGPGFGLGLAISRRAVQLHGGRVTARNREGGGLVIELELPLASGRFSAEPSAH